MKKSIEDTKYLFPRISYGEEPKLCETSKYSRVKKLTKAKVLRDWQKKAFLELRDSKYFLVKAFCGSGKTTLFVVLSLWDIVKNKKKQLFIAPQSHIGSGFSISGEFNVPDLGKVYLSKPLNFCEDSEKKTDMLVNWLLSDFKSDSFKELKSKEKEYAINGNCIATATHQCFVAAMEKIIEREKSGEKDLFNKAMKNLSFYVDEAHHIKSGNPKEDKKEIENYNRLGNITQLIRNNSNSRIGLATATYHRGDSYQIVHLEEFDIYELDFLSHFETLNINEVSVSFEEYQRDPIMQIVANIEKELQEFHLIIVPDGGQIGSKWRKYDLDLSRLKLELHKMLKRNGITDFVLELVTKETQKINKSILLKEPKEAHNNDNKKKVRIVITCKLGREGTDWCPCSRIHHASIEFGSSTLAVQTLGRLFRKFDKKNNVGVTYYIKKFDDLHSSENIRQFLSDRTNAIVALMLIDDLVNPILLPELPIKDGGIKRSYKKGKKKSICLSSVFAHEDFEKIKKQIFEEIGKKIEFENDSVEQVIRSTISQFKKIANVNDSDVVDGLKVMVLRAKSESLRAKGIDISYIRRNGFDEIKNEHGLNGNFWNGVLTKEKFKKFRDLCGEISWNEEQNSEIEKNIRKNIEIKFNRKINRGELFSTKESEAAKEIINSLEKFHEAYNQVSSEESKLIPTRQGVASKLEISMKELQKKIAFFNEIVPKGYGFFVKNSKITTKVTTAA